MRDNTGGADTRATHAAERTAREREEEAGDALEALEIAVERVLPQQVVRLCSGGDGLSCSELTAAAGDTGEKKRASIKLGAPWPAGARWCRR